MASFEIPTVAWRVHATCSDLYRWAQDEAAAEAHRAQAEALVRGLADSCALGRVQPDGESKLSEGEAGRGRPPQLALPRVVGQTHARRLEQMLE